ncbi:MAG TPA: VIT domain-containing protein [Acidobacteriota bacterium]|nr:VIT domain-containing protein [Acidobacteriota bacterium]
MTAPVVIPMIEVIEEIRRCQVGVLTVTQAARPVTLPLAKVDISARVADRVAHVTMLETFRNPHQEHLEAVYTFPLPGSSVVSSFEMKVGDRTIHGVVKERGEARRSYQQALEAGRRAALLEQERDDIFTVQVGNLPPGEEITIKLTYSERLPFFEDGTTELRLPLVVAPRYIPGQPVDRGNVGDGVEMDTDAVPDASRITPPRLAAGFDPKVGCAIQVELIRPEISGKSIEINDLCCSQHAVRTKTSSGSVVVSLSRDNERLNRDFVLRWQLAETAVQSHFLVHRTPDGELVGLVSIIPPKRDVVFGTPRDVVFVLDRSGSMEGIKMTSAARACSSLLRTLSPQDRFAIQAFDHQVEWYHPESGNRQVVFSTADEASLDQGEAYLRKVTARGGTELDMAVSHALQAIARREESTPRMPVIVLLTDGQIGDESRVLKRIQQELGAARVFTVGIDTAVNEGFLRRLATVGGGTSTFVQPGSQLEEALQAVAREMGKPVLTSLELEAGKGTIEKETIAPNRIPDVFAGRATTVFFRLKKAGSIKIKGQTVDGKKFTETIEPQSLELPALAQLWARARVMDLEDQYRIDTSRRDALKQQIIDLSVRHSILTRFTAFVVVDEQEVVNADGTRRKVVQPVEMPAEWEMQSDPSKMTLAGGYAGALPPMQFAMRSASPMPAAPPPPPAGYAPPSQPMPMPSSAKSSGGTLGAVGDAVENIAQWVLGNLPAPKKHKSVPRQESEGAAAGKPVAPSGGNREFSQAFMALLDALTQYKHSLDGGKLPSGAGLEPARQALLRILGASEIGLQLVELQRFLRSGLLELIAAVQNPKATPKAVLELFDQHQKTLEKVKAEAAPWLVPSTTTQPKPTGEFWGDSI